MIYNNFCKHCDKLIVCKIRDILIQFENEKLGVDITIDNCMEYREVE